MYNRFKTSLFQPAKIGNFQNDSKLKTLLYYVLLVLLATIPSVILIFSSVGLDYDDKTDIRSRIRNEDIPYEIVNYELVKKEVNDDDSTTIDLSETLRIIFTDSTIEELEYNPLYVGSIIIFSKYKVIYQSQFLEIIEINYNEYDELENLDFLGATNNDSEFWDKVFPVINKILEEYGPKTRAINSVIVFFAQGLFLILFSLLVAFFQRMRLASVFTFGKILQLVIYTMTPYIILTLVGDLFGLTFLTFIGVFISYIYSNIMSQAILKK